MIGTGLIGGSVGKALRAAGWHVSGTDNDPERARRALEVGAIDEIGQDLDAEITFVAVPVSSVANTAAATLAAGGVVTDVASVKAPVVDSVQSPRFVGGHPMAGSEAIGVDGARADLFAGAVWVLTPTPRTDPHAHALVHSVVRSFGAEVLTLDPAQHDRMVATVSHVPHLTAATLMELAARRNESDTALLRLAAGGFRDMTRIAAGDPDMWFDVCTENRDAIVETLDGLIESLDEMRRVVLTGDREELGRHLRAAQAARRSLPTGAPPPEQLAEVWVQIADREGELAMVTTLATELSINVHDIEVAHEIGVPTGRLILVVDADRADELVAALRAQDRRASTHVLT